MQFGQKVDIFYKVTIEGSCFFASDSLVLATIGPNTLLDLN